MADSRIDPKTPLIFEVPDGQVVVCTWAYIVSRITPMFDSITQSLNNSNGSLRIIESKLAEWAEDQDAGT